MTDALKLWPLLTATHRYDKSISTWNRGKGRLIDAPVLAYLIETRNGRILYDVGCDYDKIADPERRFRYYRPEVFDFGAPDMSEDQRLPRHLSRLGLTPLDVDLIFIGHLHFDHAGGLKELLRSGCGAEIHVHRAELDEGLSGVDSSVFTDELQDDEGKTLPFRLMESEYSVAPGVSAVFTPGHTAGHMSMWIELPSGKPVLLAGDAADLQENLDDEVAPGTFRAGGHDQSVESIRKLKRLANETGAWIWPNHDLPFYRSLQPFPHAYS